jgi:hypothetical protein
MTRQRFGTHGPSRSVQNRRQRRIQPGHFGLQLIDTSHQTITFSPDRHLGSEALREHVRMNHHTITDRRLTAQLPDPTISTR